MIAYDHHIIYEPKLRTTPSSEQHYEHSVVIRRSPCKKWQKIFSQKWDFFNNQGRDISLYTDRHFAQTQRGQKWAFDVDEVVTFLWESGRDVITYSPQEKFTEALLEYWSLHILLPIYFTVEERFDFLHAGAVEISGNPVLFMAESYGGKSTMTDFFIQRGHAMISDDKVALIEQGDDFLSVPSHPHHRPYRKMEDLGHRVEHMVLSPMPIHAVYDLERADADAPVTIDEIKGIEKFKALRYGSEINFSFLKAKRFDLLSRLANRVPVFRVRVPWDLERLQEVHDTIVAHSNQIEG